MDNEKEITKVAEILRLLRSSLEILEKKHDKLGNELATLMLKRVKRLEQDLRTLGESDAANVSVIEGLIPVIETLETKVEPCTSCPKYVKETQRTDFELKMANYKALKTSGEDEKAKKALKEIRRKYGDFSKAWIEVGHFYSSEDDLKNAVACYRVADEIGDLDYYPLCMIGQAFYVDEEYNNAITELEKSLVKYTPSYRCPRFYHILGKSYSKVGSLEDVVRISKFVDIPDEPYEPALVRAYLYFLMNEYSKSLEELDTIDLSESQQARFLRAILTSVKPYKNAKREIIQIMKKSEADLLLLDGLDYALKSKLFDKNCKYLKEIISQFGKWIKAGSFNKLISQLLNAALVLVHNAGCKYTEFVLELLKEVKEQSQLDILDISLTLFLTKAGESDVALQLAKERNDPVVWFSYAVGLCESGNREEAIKYFKKTIELDPKAKPVWGCLIESLEVLGRKEELERTREEAKKQFGGKERASQDECPD
ncbi:MAG: tetratricopeptide repeat protein [Candidatus Thorarchaeota archaeon]|jgi:tetratricopeptide (TPR) repeat protein